MHTMHACMCVRLNRQLSDSFQAHFISSSSYRIQSACHEVNNAAKDASLSVYFQPGMSRPIWVHITDGVSSYSSVQCQSRTSMRRTALTVATTSRQPMLDLGIFAKSA